MQGKGQLNAPTQTNQNPSTASVCVAAKAHMGKRGEGSAWGKAPAPTQSITTTTTNRPQGAGGRAGALGVNRRTTWAGGGQVGRVVIPNRNNPGQAEPQVKGAGGGNVTWGGSAWR